MATLIDLSLSGDLTSTHPIYPGYNNGGVGAQTSYYLYGNASNSGIRTNGNFLVNGNIYFGSSSVWLTDWLNQSVKTNAGPTFAEVYTTGWFRNTAANAGLYHNSNGNHFYSRNSNTWVVTSSSGALELQFRAGHEGTLRGMLYGDTNNNFGLLSSDGSWSVRVNNSEVELYHVTYADDFRPNIIYDRNNTGYYLNLDGTSNLWKLYVNAKYSYFGSSSNWDSGSLNGTNDTITNVHFQGHTDFWIGAGNTKWYTGVVSGHHDLLINTMQSSGSNTRGITFTASLSGGSVYRLGRWFANNTQATSYLQVDGSIKIGATSDYYSTPVAKLHITGATSGEDVLAVDGVNGRLFTVTDDLSDSLFSVNTVAGLPVMEAFADNTIKLGNFTNPIEIDSSANIVIPGTITASGYNDANWNTAYGWGNHSGLYLGVNAKAADSNLLDGLDLHTGRNNEVNKVVRTDANGYIQAGWINTTSGDNGTTAIARIYASQDGYIRYYTPANFRALITDGVYQPAGSYAASSHTHTPSQVGLGNVSNTAQVTTTYNSSLNSDSRNSRGVTRLYRRDSDTDYSVQTYWTGARWRLYGYEGDSNHADTHVGYADSAGSASSATTANRLDTYGIIYGDDWNNYYVNGKLIAGQAHGWSGPNGPSGAYAYGSYLSYRQEGSGQWQMFLGENSGNSTSNAYKMYIRSGWNGTWGGWQRLVDMAGDTCHISNGTTVTFKAEATAQWGSPSTAIVEIKGQSDNWAIKSYRWVTKAPNFNGSSFRLERYSQDAGWNLLGEVPINTTDWEWQGEIMWGLSDSRAKTNVVDMTNGLSKISQIRPVTFDWSPVEGVSDREGADFGFIAQELEEVVPEAVHTRADGYKTVRYEKVVPVLLQAVKEQQATINNLLSRIEALESR